MTGALILTGLLAVAGVVAWLGDRWLHHLEASDYPEVGQLLRAGLLTETERRWIDRELHVVSKPRLYDWSEQGDPL